jgi:hypothetical protein
VQLLGRASGSVKLEGSPNVLSLDATTAPRGIVSELYKHEACLRLTLRLVRDTLDIEPGTRIVIKVSACASNFGKGLYATSQKAGKDSQERRGS